MKHSTLALFTLSLRCLATVSGYQLVREYRGPGFFDDWDFQVGSDWTTHGQVNYLSANDAASQKLAYVNKIGNAIIKVDNSTWLGSGAPRNSIRITSKQPITQNSVLILDAIHAPYGCSTWPAFWTVGQNWPNGGEIDIYEGVHQQTNNQMTLHTKTGCTKDANTAQTGTTLSSNCDANANSNAGCGIRDSSSASYGAGFAANRGGVWAVQWANDGIFIWFFPRSKIPCDIHNDVPNPGAWGPPSAAWPGSTCNPSNFFGPQNLVFDITLCGDWAGEPNTWAASGCGGTCSGWVQDPGNFKNAYFEVKRIAFYGP